MLSVLTTDGRGSPSALPIETSVGSPREVRVTRATTTAPIVSQTASLVSTTTGRGPTGGGSSAHQTSALRIGPGRLLLADEAAERGGENPAVGDHDHAADGTGCQQFEHRAAARCQLGP